VVKKGFSRRRLQRSQEQAQMGIDRKKLLSGVGVRLITKEISQKPMIG